MYRQRENIVEKRVTIDERDLSAFASLGGELARHAKAGAERILQTHRRGESISTSDYAKVALEFAQSIVRGGGTPPLFMDGYFTERFLSGEQPNYNFPASGLPNTDGETEIGSIFRI